MAGSSQRSINQILINLLPRTAHSATICGQTGCGKTVFILDLLQGPYRGFLVRSKLGGKAFTADQIDALDNTEIEKMCARYEARLGAAMTKTLRSAALQLYAGVASMFLLIPAENEPGLIADLEGDPFVGHALSSATCELYHRYGMFLAPLTAVLTTMKHCQFGGHQCPVRINNVGEQADGGEPRDVAKQHTSRDSVS